MIFLLKNRVTPRDPYEEEFTNRYKKFVFFPLLEHHPVDPSGLKQLLNSKEFQHNTDALIVTSQRAVEQLNSSILNEEILELPIYTVGPATSKILNASGFKNIRGGLDAGDGSKLADVMLNDVNRSGNERLKNFVFLTGATRRDIISKRLNAADDVSLVERVVYETQDLENLQENFEKMFQASIDNDSDENRWIVFFSPSGSDAIIRALASKPRTAYKIAAIGPTTRDYLHRNGFTVDAMAEKPHAPSLAKAIFD